MPKGQNENKAACPVKIAALRGTLLDILVFLVPRRLRNLEGLALKMSSSVVTGLRGPFFATSQPRNLATPQLRNPATSQPRNFVTSQLRYSSPDASTFLEIRDYSPGGSRMAPRRRPAPGRGGRCSRIGAGGAAGGGRKPPPCPGTHETGWRLGASSSTRSLSRAARTPRARARRCFWPPDRLTPFSWIFDSRPEGNCSTT